MLDDAQKRWLVGLPERLARVQTDLAHVREGIRALSEAETHRKLMPGDRQQGRRLRWEHDRLRHELGLIRAAVAAFRSQGGGAEREP